MLAFLSEVGKVYYKYRSVLRKGHPGGKVGMEIEDL